MSDRTSKQPKDVLLTANQHNIVQRLLSGEKAPSIAYAKKRAVDTVRQTIRAIYSRFGVRDAAELAAGIADGEFNVRVTDGANSEHDLRSGLKAIGDALTKMRAENARKGTKRRRVHVSLHEDEIDAILSRADAAR